MLSNDHRPKTFNDYVGQKGPVNYIKSIIKQNSHPSGILISGDSGIGKTTLAQLYVRSTLCLNREEGSYEGCGECDVCLGNSKHNIFEYRITEATVFKDIVGDLIELTKAAPVIDRENIRDDNSHRFIIIDEVQNATRQSISPFLDSLEFSHSKVTIILVSMDLSKMDAIVRDAIDSRCVELSLDSFSEEKIADNLCNKYEYLDIDSAKLIAYLSHGNMRKAWSLLEYFLAQMIVEEITPDVIYQQKFGGMSSTLFSNFVEALEEGVWHDTFKILKTISNAEECAVDLLLRYLVEQELSREGINLVSSLSTWYQCIYKAPLESIVIPYQGKVILKESLPKNDFVPEVIKEDKILPFEATASDLSNMRDSILNQVSSIKGQNVQVKEDIPKCLTFKTLLELISYYAEPDGQLI